MRRRSIVAVGLVSAALALTGCSSSGPGTDAGPASQAAGGKRARIYVVSPQSGGDAAIGLGVRNAAQLAVTQATARGDFPGWNLELVTIDDKGDSAEAASAAKKIAGDEQAVAVVGPVFSGQTAAMQKPLADAGILEVSSSATNPALTKGEHYRTSATRPFPSFFRIAAPDDAHGPALAQHVLTHKAKRAYVLDDADDYGRALAGAFTDTFTRGGGTVVGRGSVDTESSTQPAALVDKIVAAKPDVVMVGAADVQAAPLSAALKKKGLKAPVIGGDSVATEKYVVLAGPVAARDAGTGAGTPLDATDAGRRFEADYRAAGFREPATLDGSLAYDATNVVLAALKTALPSAASAADARPAVVKAAQSVSLTGARGPIAFDRFGDITPRSVTVFVLSGGTWKPSKTYRD